MYIILLGAPGAGKGTQAKLLSERLDIAHVSSGDLLRDNIKRGTDLGLQAKGFMDRGELVPDGTVINMIVEHLSTPSCVHGAMLDGFPRTIPQADALNVALQNGFRQGVTAVLYIKVENEELLSRLSGRWICRSCQTPYHEVYNAPRVKGVCDSCGGELYQREDDTRATAERRLQVYFNQTLPLIDYYNKRDLLIEIDGQREVEEVNRDLITALKKVEQPGGVTESLLA
ncbi:MAG: adenylate kinase [Chloroflexi bacterium]|uniref:Adenylate kinase n=1 Tax=Candidatus Chlorohelix allophototropha TaxID=3003348 RepID=A0A8T7M0K3_9CHLR|nr:adenylate kinase [Chloroflexota bacterium]WJW65646.1 adenylate kinase [Chloroflexota bacterium L227-S17]